MVAEASGAIEALRVLGAGISGVSAAIEAAELGKRVVRAPAAGA